MNPVVEARQPAASVSSREYGGAAPSSRDPPAGLVSTPELTFHMTLPTLAELSRKQLAQLARRRGIAGWHDMRKAQLLRALRRAAGGQHESSSPELDRPPADRSIRAAAQALHAGRANGIGSGKAAAAHRGGPAGEVALPTDELTARLCDPQWVELRWELSPATRDRAQAALGAEWRRAVLVLRGVDLGRDGLTTQLHRHAEDIVVHPDARCWFVPVFGSCGNLQFQIGYRAPSGRFFALARSGVVSSPPGSPSAVNSCGQPRGAEAAPAASASQPLNGRAKANGTFAAGSEFHLDAALIVSGTTHPQAQLSVNGQRVPLAADGSFTLRLALADGRHIFPAVSVTPDGHESHTILLAVERNTKVMEPQCLRDDDAE